MSSEQQAGEQGIGPASGEIVELWTPERSAQRMALDSQKQQSPEDRGMVLGEVYLLIADLDYASLCQLRLELQSGSGSSDGAGRLPA